MMRPPGASWACSAASSRLMPSAKAGHGGATANAAAQQAKKAVVDRAKRRVGASSNGSAKTVKVGSAHWDNTELRILDDGLRQYPEDQFSNMTIYVKIADMLPKKSVREVAARLRQMQDSKKAEFGWLGNRSRTGAAASMAGFGPGLYMDQRAMQMPGPHLADRVLEGQITHLLNENHQTINRIRDNMLAGRLIDNYNCMHKFNDNVNSIMAMLNSLPVRMQELPVQVNRYLILPHPGDARVPGAMPPGQYASPKPEPAAAGNAVGGPAASQGHPPPGYGEAAARGPPAAGSAAAPAAADAPTKASEGQAK